MKIAFFELEHWEEPILKKELTGHELYLSSEKLTLDHLPDRNDFEVICTFIDSSGSREILEHFSNLRLYATRSTGFDHIDLKAAEEKQIQVSNVPAYGDNTVAEYTFGLLLSLTRKIYQAIDQVKEHGSFNVSGLRGIDLKGKTIGVVGTGRIGREVIKIAHGFDMTVVAYDIYPNKTLEEQGLLTYVSLNELLGRSDVITLHCPATPETKHTINSGNIQFIKNGAFLVNTARGSLIETEALVTALRTGKLAGAALDVLEEEGEIKNELNFLISPHPQSNDLKSMLYNHILIDMQNVLISPHNAFNSQEALERILKTTIDTIQSFARGEAKNVAR
ncbi:MAG: hydroxyacid dehydrogenase [Anaplasmataceae bacterium]|nr:hydroxyacid dehydrogenase [Anaplasmataceae bacterium]